jgi:hypothetical protein
MSIQCNSCMEFAMFTYGHSRHDAVSSSLDSNQRRFERGVVRHAVSKGENPNALLPQLSGGALGFGNWLLRSTPFRGVTLRD